MRIVKNNFSVYAMEVEVYVVFVKTCHVDVEEMFAT